MKKFLNTMLITAAVVAASTGAYAASAGKVAQGAYVGASAGAANTNVKYNMVSTNPSTITTGKTSADEIKKNSSNAGNTAGIFGLIAGYNFQSGSIVFGGETYGGFDSAKVTVLNDNGSGNATETAAAGSLTVKRTNFIGFAPRIGFMVAPNTLMYARLGMEAGKWKATMTPNTNMIGSPNSNATTPSPESQNLSRNTVNASKGGFRFAPGLGMEVYMGKAFVRAQYSYLFGPKINLSQDMRGYSDFQFVDSSFFVHKVSPLPSQAA
jgi:hypothetical protein